jgi:imidazolonepropionase-like amidohydrolase
VLAGTDSPINPYGMSLLLELEHYVRGGLTPAEALRTATAVPAEALGISADLGTIDAGKLADLIVVDGNPLDDIRQLRRVRQVMRGGVLHEVQALLARP